jgi:hypothetical protein
MLLPAYDQAELLQPIFSYKVNVPSIAGIETEVMRILAGAGHSGMGSSILLAILWIIRETQIAGLRFDHAKLKKVRRYVETSEQERD